MIQLQGPFTLYNTLNRIKEPFKPLHEGHVGLYVCGPTVYGSPHLGHARSAIVFDLLNRVLRSQGHKVRYVRNITDVGHLENEDTETGEDKIVKQAILEKRLPMEVAQAYTRDYHKMTGLLGCMPPNIEPVASGHTSEQITMIDSIIRQGYAYITNGSVYFDVQKYASEHNYGSLSRMKIEGMQNNSRTGLVRQDEKKSSLDFALWKKADSSNQMQWDSPWGKGFPGWHIECTAMSHKYLGKHFDIHGGGLDLQFPHHEAEIAQSMAALNNQPAAYWVHHNLLTIDGQKMSKSKKNFITINEFFSGKNELFARPFSPMLLRFFFLRTHYRNVVEITKEALLSSEKGLERLLRLLYTTKQVHRGIEPESYKLEETTAGAYLQQAMNHLLDDMDTPKAIANLYQSGEELAHGTPSKLSSYSSGVFAYIIEEILGLAVQSPTETTKSINLDGALNKLLALREAARSKKNYVLSDSLRDIAIELGFSIEDQPNAGPRVVQKQVSFEHD